MTNHQIVITSDLNGPPTSAEFALVGVGFSPRGICCLARASRIPCPLRGLGMTICEFVANVATLGREL